ncbi:hypothetical protein, partial [Citrobacter koseri]|uniref:hypothetical protein n=1 Tax=Citrobacter koseri TaxID=545 RepID=UPI001F15A03B
MDNSSLSNPGGSVTADGTTTTGLSLSLKDSNGNPVTGVNSSSLSFHVTDGNGNTVSAPDVTVGSVT